MNYMGTQFGGSLYSMTDPWYCLLLIAALGDDYLIWDKAASVRFRRPGRGKVTARFHLSEERLSEIKKELSTAEKSEPIFRVEVLDEDGLLVSEIEKTISIRKKKTQSAPPQS